jgi:heat shock protein HtpX
MSSAIKTAVLLAGLSALFIMLGGMLGGQTGLVIAFVLAAVMNIGSYWFSDKLVLRMYRASEVDLNNPAADDQVLVRVTRRLVQKAGLPMPRVYVIPDDSPNAFATGRNPRHAAVAATEGILRLLNEDELEGVIGHELSHVQHRDILISSVAATIAAAIMMIANMARFAAFFNTGGRDRDDGPNPLVLLATAILAPFAAMLIQAAISRQREYAADASGAHLAGSPEGLASALRKIDAVARRVPLDASPATAHLFIIKPTLAGLGNLFSTHPPTEDRIRALLGHS